MKKLLFLFLLAVTVPSISFAQAEKPVVVSTKKHKVIFQLTTSDTLSHKGLVRQLNNLLNAAPNAKLEVVCHGPGITFLQTDVTKQAEKIKELKARGVDFVACENTLRERKIKPTDLLQQDSRIVPAGIVEIVMKQEKGWAYIKAGN